MKTPVTLAEAIREIEKLRADVDELQRWRKASVLEILNSITRTDAIGTVIEQHQLPTPL